MKSTDVAPPKPLTSRGQRTRDQLVAAARTIFERDGFASARITDIADLAGVAHGTFYTYFDSKDEIFRELIVIVRDEMLRGDAAASDAPQAERVEAPWASIARANRRYLATYRANHRLMVIWEQAATLNDEFQGTLGESRQQFTERAERKIRELQEQGVADATLDARYAAVALGAMVSKFAYIWFTGREVFDFEKAVQQLTRIWCAALGIDASDLP
jgi:AcrR family transcriptional regulator